MLSLFPFAHQNLLFYIVNAQRYLAQYQCLADLPEYSEIKSSTMAHTNDYRAVQSLDFAVFIGLHPLLIAYHLAHPPNEP